MLLEVAVGAVRAALVPVPVPVPVLMLVPDDLTVATDLADNEDNDGNVRSSSAMANLKLAREKLTSLSDGPANANEAGPTP